MNAAWMVYGVAVGSLAAGIAALLYALRRDSGRPVRWIWVGAMTVTVVLTAAAPLRTEATAPSSVVAPAGSAVVASAMTGAPSLGARARGALDDITRIATWPLQTAVAAAAKLPPVAQRSATILSLVAALLGLVALLVVYARVMTLRSTWKRVALLGVPVRVAPAAGPAVVGVAPPEIVVPDWLLARTADEQRLVLEHEQSHVRAGDPLLLLTACVAVACMPWNPALWYMLARLRLAVEVDCDRRVLRAGAPTRSYAQLLIELSQHRSLLSPAMPAFSHSVSHLERRLLAMTARPSRTSVTARVGTMLLASLALLAACESKLPTSAEIDGMTAADATTRASSYVKLDTSRVLYVVDGRATTKQEAEAIAASEIAQIDIKGGRLSSDSSVVGILTKRRASGTVTDTVTVVFGDSAVSAARAGTTIKADGILMLRKSDTTRAAGDGSTRVRVKGSMSGTQSPPLVVIDGVEKENVDLKSISPETIESIEVVKGAAAAQRFTNPKAANGVIVIKTKK